MSQPGFSVHFFADQSAYQPLWSSLASAFAWFDTGFPTTYAAKHLQAALRLGQGKSATGSCIEKATASALGLIAAELAGFAEFGGGSGNLSIAAVCVGFASVVRDVLSVIRDGLTKKSTATDYDVLAWMEPRRD